MIKYIEEDITTVNEGIIAQGVNCQGAMGAGVARAIMNKWPDVPHSYHNYVDQHKPGGHLLGDVNDVELARDTLFVYNCFTQEFFGGDGKRYASPDAIRESLTRVCEDAVDKELNVAMPLIGCGLAGLSWDDDVKPIVEELSERYQDVDIIISI